MSEESQRSESLIAAQDDSPEKAIANLVEAVTIQNDTIRKLADSVRILNSRVEQLENDRPTKLIG